MDLRARVEELTGKGFYEIEINGLVEIYGAVYHTTLCSTCSQDLRRAYTELKQWLHKGAETPNDMAKQKKYRFKKGLENSQVPFPKYRLMVNARNLDKYAKYMLENPKRAEMIEEIPDDEAKPAKGKGKPSQEPNENAE